MVELQTQPTQTQPHAETTKKVSWLKIILTLFLIIVVTALIAEAYWFFILNKSEAGFTDTVKVATPSAKPATSTAQNDETAGWKTTYTNKEGNYSLKYPNNYTKVAVTKDQLNPYTHQHEFTSPDYESATSGPKNHTAGKGSSFHVDVCGKPNFCLANLANLSGDKLELYVSNLIDYEIDGLDGKRFNFVSSHAYRYDITQVKRGSVLYNITLLYGRHEIEKKDLKVLNLMLSTFKFID